MTGDAIEIAIVQELTRLGRVGSAIPDTQKAWTAAILTRLSRLGRRCGFTPYTSKGNRRTDPDAGEWVYDLTWIQYDRQRYIAAVPLVCESELGADARDVQDDFCKLMLARAHHRVMVFDAANPHSAQRITEKLIDELEHSGVTARGDRYLFAGLLEDAWGFACRWHRAASGPTSRSTRAFASRRL